MKLVPHLEQVSFITLNLEILEKGNLKISPCRQCGHLPCHTALTEFFIAFAGAVPEVSQRGNCQIRSHKHVQDAKVDPSCDAYISVADVVLKRCFAHGTLGV
jgi:hypothetical protein